MGWTATNPTSIGGDTKKSDWDALWDNCDFCYVASATVEFFGQSSAPTGWTKKTDWTDNSMLVYTTGSIGSGGSDDPTSTWTTAIAILNESSHTHSIQAHDHDLASGSTLGQTTPGPSDRKKPVTDTQSALTSGNGTAHTHTPTQDDLAFLYQKIIAATKDVGSWTAVNPVSATGDAMKQNAHWAVLWANINYCYLEAATIQFFGQSSAPTGWIKKTDWTDNSMLVYTTGAIGNGGADDPTSTWTTTISPSDENSHVHDLTDHTHSLPDSAVPPVIPASIYYVATTGNPSAANTGPGSTHNHTVNQDSFSPLYQKMIAATKDIGNWIDTDPVSLYGPTKKNHYDTAWDNIVFNYFAAGTIKVFGQSSAPTGWTKKTDWTNNSMLVYTTGSISSGGSDDPTSIWTTAIGIQNESSHTHSQNHTHTLPSGTNLGGSGSYSTTTENPSVANTGSGSAHNHGVTQDSFASLYQTMIAATKDT